MKIDGKTTCIDIKKYNFTINCIVNEYKDMLGR